MIFPQIQHNKPKLENHMETPQNQLATVQPQHHYQMTAFSSMQGFEDSQRIALCLASSKLVPTDYQGKENIGNVLIALELSQRIGASPLAVMQSLHIIEGRPSWASSFIIASLNACGRFSPLRFRVQDLGPQEVVQEKSWWDKKAGERKTRTIRVNLKRNLEFVAWCYDRATGEVLEGPAVSYEMAVREEWWTKPGSKWLTMPELMGRYRAAAFFGRLYAPDVLNGMQTTEEAADIIDIEATPVTQHLSTVASINDRIAAPQQPAPPAEPAPEPKPRKSAAERANAAVKRKPEPEPEPAPVVDVAPEPEPVPKPSQEGEEELIAATPATELQGANDADWS